MEAYDERTLKKVIDMATVDMNAIANKSANRPAWALGVEGVAYEALRSFRREIADMLREQQAAEITRRFTPSNRQQEEVEND